VLASRSIRARLLVGILISLAVILGAAALASYAVSRHEAEELFGARLATSARVLESLVAKQVAHATLAEPIIVELPKELELLEGDAGTPYGHPYETKIAFQVWRDDGVLLARSASAPKASLGTNTAGFAERRLDGVLWQTFVLKSGNTWIHVAEKDEVRGELVHDLGTAVMTPLIIGALLLLLVAYLMVTYGLAPLRELAATIEKRDPTTLGKLEISAVPREVAIVVQALNDLLDRVRLALEHERRFTDAAAHELRTPLAALKVHADNLKRATSGADRDLSLDRLLRAIERAVRLTEQMLTYSRSQNDSDREAPVPIRLSTLAHEAAASVEPLLRERSQRIRIAADGAAAGIEFVGEPLKIQRLLHNLIDNAARYAPPASEIDICISGDDKTLTLSVANHGKPIPPELREHVFEPYYRVPGSASEGSGLGLAIVQEIAQRHRATVDISSITDTDGTIVRVRFPVARDAVRRRISTARRG
jgi:two-component system sensor histidine kinase QseC